MLKYNIIAIIPARGGSKGILNKNLIEFCEKPLISWSILQCQKSELINDIYITSDNHDILAVSTANNAKTIKRPSVLSTDQATSESALIHALKVIQSRTSKKIDYIVFLQCTSPLRAVSDIDNAIKKIIHEKADSLFSSSKLGIFNLWAHQCGSLKSINYDYTNRKRRQETEPQFLENGSIYVFRPEVLLNNNNRLGGKITMYEMDFWKSWEIDTIDEKELCEWYFEKYLLHEY